MKLLSNTIKIFQRLNDIIFCARAKKIVLAAFLYLFSFIVIMIPIYDNENNMYVETGNILFEKAEKHLKSNNGYYYKFLDKDMKKTYDKIYKGISSFNYSINIVPINKKNLEKVYYSIIFDNPELIYLSDKYRYGQNENGDVYVFYPIYTMDKKATTDKIREINTEVKSIKEAVKNLSDYNKELYIHDYILKKCSYINNNDIDSTMYGAIINGKANCRGYSAAYSYILNSCGIKSGQIIGSITKNGKQEGHSWNFVILDGEYYYCDLCFDDIKSEDAGDAVPYHYSFFNTTYEEMALSHNFEMQKKYLYNIDKTNSGKYSYMKQNGLYASTYKDACDIIKNKLAAAKAFNKPLLIQCENNKDYETLCKMLDEKMDEIIKEKDINISHCKYLKIQNGNTLIIYDLK